MPNCVVFSDRAMTALLVETYENIKTETGGVFLGYRKGDVWYVLESIDPGPNSIFRATYFEYDQQYINHLINKVSMLYREQLDLIGLWHRHPGSLDIFSQTDDGTNKQYANLGSEGAISALVNIDPAFRLTVYEVKKPLAYRKIKHIVGDDNIPSQLLNYISSNTILNKINNYAGKISEEESSSPFSAAAQKYSKLNIKQDAQTYSTQKEKKANGEGLYFSAALHEYLKKRTFGDVVVRDVSKVATWVDDKIERILETLSDDIDYLASVGINCNMAVNGNGYLELTESLKDARAAACPLKILLDSTESSVFFKYNEYTYLYHPGLFEESFTEHIIGGAKQ